MTIDLQSLPPLTKSPHGALVRVIASDGGIHDIPEVNLDLARRIDPELRLIPAANFNELVLTAEDRWFLWGLKIKS